MILNTNLNLKSEKDRIKTFKNWSSKRFTNIGWLAAAGFYYFDYEDVVRCAFCNITLRNWREEDDPYDEHNRWAPSCPYLNGISPDIRLKSEYERLKTFETWPVDFPDDLSLSSAGFYYTGRGDAVKCIFCKIQIEDWKENDNPLDDHRKWAPYCPYLRGFDVENIDLNPENPTIIPNNNSYDVCGM